MQLQLQRGRLMGHATAAADLTPSPSLFPSLLLSPLAVAHKTIESVAHRDCWTCQAGGRRKRGGVGEGRQLQSKCTLCCRIAVIGKVLSKVAPHAPLQLQLL